MFGAFAGHACGAARVMRAQGSGHVIQMSSLAGGVRSALGGSGCTRRTKFALEGMSEGLAAGGVAPLGIAVTMVEPGPVPHRARPGARRRGPSR